MNENSVRKDQSVRITIVMLVCNRPQLIDRAVRSILAQDLQEWELIVVQDGPNGQIEDIMRGWVRRDSRIRHCPKEKSGKLAEAYNFGLKHARGEYISILDDDDYWITRDKLSCQMMFLETHPDYIGCGGGMLVTDETGLPLMRCLKPEHDSRLRKYALMANPMAHSTMMFRRNTGEQVNYYDEALPGLPDWDLWLNLGRVGKLYNFPELFACYTLWKRSVSFQRQRNNARAALQIVWRYRKSYGHFALALALAIISTLYSYLPTLVTGRLYSHLSLLKKIVFAGGASQNEKRNVSSASL